MKIKEREKRNECLNLAREKVVEYESERYELLLVSLDHSQKTWKKTSGSGNQRKN